MKKAYCIVSVAPVRQTYTDQSEMLTQLLYGEFCSILEVKNSFTKVKIDFDGYEGWVDTKQISAPIETCLGEKHMIDEVFVSHDFKEGKMLLSIGSEVDFETISGINMEPKLIRTSIVKLAERFLNVPYLWGGRSFFGLDCSGFTQLVYKVHGIKIPRDAYLQAEFGETRDFLEESEFGDLAFFENEEGKIIHVGIVLNPNQIIHAHGKVRIDSLDYSGIFNSDLNKHTHKLRFVKTFL